METDLDKLQWSELKNQIHQRWSRLTDDDISILNDGTESFVALLRKRYGYGKAQAEIEISNWLDGIKSHARKLKE